MYCPREPDRYIYFQWEHRSQFDEHIRYLDSSDDGILQLPDVKVSNRYQDTGFIYAMFRTAFLMIMDRFLQGRAYFESKGPPVFATNNENIQSFVKGSAAEVKVNVYSTSAIKCYNLTEISSKSLTLSDIDVEINSILLRESFHDAFITVNGTEISFVLKELNDHGPRTFNVTVCNSYGQESFVIHSKPTVNYSLGERALSSKAVIIIMVLLIIIAVLVVVMGLTYRHNSDIMTIVNTLDADNRNSFSVSAENSSGLSDNEISVSENYDDGYERPYTTLLTNDRVGDTHVYLNTHENSNEEFLNSMDNTACRHTIECEVHTYSLKKAKTNSLEDDDIEMVTMSNVENTSKETDGDIQRPYNDRKRNNVEYINLSLKQ
ncbi:unnamed protein product [Mytilus edulis]|uniref:Uncharacterized protein n=1 Tax=Mytilus edulis TaxID=6550 RepID=A0A8S3UA84_MYTED|nr:unnamed protein product [Mytilus edulis]